MKRISLVLFLCVLGFGRCALADINQDLTVNISIQVHHDNCNMCSQESWVNNPGWLGQEGPNPTTGYADFSSVMPPWAYSYTTADPLSWQGGCQMDYCSYSADYYGGGTITVQGPNGLVFTGTYLSGSYSGGYGCIINQCAGGQAATFSFKGVWSNGIVGYGTVTNEFSVHEGEFLNEDDNYANLQMFVAPEPSSLTLLGSSLLGIAAICRRRMNL